MVKINTIDLFLDSPRKKEDSKLEIIEETLQLIPQKYKELQETTMNNSMLKIGQPRRNGYISRNIQPFTTESR